MTESIYDVCSGKFDANEDLNGLLQCISDGHDTVRMLALKMAVDTFCFCSLTIFLSSATTAKIG